MRRSFLALLAVGLFAVCRAESAPGFLGWIPVQYVPPGQELVLDMHRFFEPAEGFSLKVGDAESGNCTVSYDPARLELRATPAADARGVLDVPIQVIDGRGRPAGREAVLTIALSEPGLPAGFPVVFAESRSDERMVFRAELDRQASLRDISAVLELPDGSSRKTPFRKDGSAIVVPVGDAPEGSWIRLTAADAEDRIARPVRARVHPAGGFLWQDGIIYYAFTDRFENGDRGNDRPVSGGAVAEQANYQGGDFAGIRKRIQEGYFQKLGINVLWLAPLNRNPDGAWQEYLPPYRHYTGYHGYWPVSHSEVEPRFGGEKGLTELGDAARQNGIRLIADLVLKHVHVDHPLWKEHPEWFGSLLLPDGRKNLRLWDEQQFTTWFEEWLPGFDFDKPEPVAFLISNAEKWAVRFRLDGYRLDAVKHIKYSFWPKFRTAMRSLEHREGLAPMYFVGETFMDRAGIMSFVGPNMLDGQFDFPLYDTIMEVFARGTRGFAELEASLSASETIYGKETLMSPLIGNHDKSRFMAYADGDLPKSAKDDEEEIGWADPPRVDNPASYGKLRLALGFLLSIDGVPMIYYGDEIGLTGAGDPDNRRMMPPESSLDSAQRSVRETFSRLTALRSAHPALRYGSRRMLLAEDTRYAFARRHFDDRVLAVWNASNAGSDFDLAVAPELPDGEYEDALSGLRLKVASGRAAFRLPAMSQAFFVPLPRPAGPR